ncbi:hypothetical protein FNAPI_8306 [Fusarium napiforme]|uniref:Uncharacterized protein n=1 Tax=Fusarium napiforme TaxID=42672 RepID=A0A8H5J4U6_9HYPO|nr:hypothetical protein FNAPI_8306 [Fusarium napiforme]
MHIPSLLLSILGVASIASAFPSQISKPGQQSQKLDANADEDSLRYQPAFYFEKGNCTRRKAFDDDGNKITRVSNPADCFQRSRLSNRKAYTRKRCNNGWCAYMYEYDLAWGLLTNRKPRWESIVVFVKNNTVQHVAASEKGEFIRRDKPHLQEGHPLMLNHGPNSWLSIFFRFANKGHVEKIRKDVGEWVVPNLVDWDGSPTPRPFHLADPFHLEDKHFTDTLYEAAGECVPGFDCGKVEAKDTHKEKQKEKVKAKDKGKNEEEVKDSEKKFDIKENGNVKGKDNHEAEEEDEKPGKGPEEMEFVKFDPEGDQHDKKDKEDDEKEEKKENKFDIKENVKDKEDNKENEKEDDKKDDKKEENQFDIKEQKDNKDDKKEGENQFDIKEQKDNKDDKKDDKDDKKGEKKEENQFDIKEQKDEDK